MIDIVFDGPPAPESGRFVEVEDTNTGRSVARGQWVQRSDGYWALRMLDPNALMDESDHLRARVAELEAALRTWPEQWHDYYCNARAGELCNCGAEVTNAARAAALKLLGEP